MTLLIEQVRLGDGRTADVFIEGNRFRSIVPHFDHPERADEVIDGRGFALMPAFYNTHCHAAMTLLRGLADDLELFPWLSEHIWPAEAKLTPELAYAGNRLAILEMIRSGTVYFNDMYWYQLQTIRAAGELGVRLGVSELIFANLDDHRLNNAELAGLEKPGFVEVLIGPHAVYTTTRAQLEAAAERSARERRRVHIHLSETAREVAECRETHGVSPVAYLDRCGLLSDRCVLAHCVHLSAEDIALIRERGAIVAHMPVSNMKLASGMMPYDELRRAGCRLTLGTDGCASNNNLSMFDEMKFAALLAKTRTLSPTVAPATEIYEMATRAGAEAAGLDAGVIAEGKLADALLIDLAQPALVGADHLVSHLVYSAGPEVIDTVICDGRVLMRHRRVPGEEEIIAEAKRASAQLREKL